MAPQRKAARRWLISGDVQGVGFRAFAQDRATSMGISGWARNLDDGSVEVYGVGAPDRLSDFAAALHLGPRMSQVRGVDEKEAAVETVSGFSVR